MGQSRTSADTEDMISIALVTAGAIALDALAVRYGQDSRRADRRIL